jgi:hypothetical protein
MSKFSNGKRLGVVAVVLLGFVLAGSSLYFAVRKAPQRTQQNRLPRQTSFQDASTGVKVKYPEATAKTQTISEADRKEKILLRLAAQEHRPPMLVTLRSESGLRVVANLTKATIIDILMRNSDKALPQRFEGFKKESSRRYEHDRRDAGEIIFTYQSPVKGERIKQRLVMLVKDDDTAVYLAMQTKEADFSRYNVEVFNPMAATLDF